MKKIILLGIAASALVSCGDNINPSGNVITVERDVTEFHKIVVEGAINAVVTMGDETTLEITADDNVLPYIETFVRGGVLNVRVKDRTSFRGKPTLKATIGAVELTGCEASGASTIKFVNTLAASELHMELQGASRCTGTFDAGEMQVELHGASSMEAAGTASKLNLICHGASVFGDFDFAANEVTANLHGASRATLTVNDRLTVNAEGASTFRYKGNPAEVNRNASGASTIERAD